MSISDAVNTEMDQSIDDSNLVFGKLGLDWNQYIKQDEKFLRPEELHDLKGDCSKLVKATGWKHEYTFESMLDEMIDYWLDYYQK